MRGHVRKFYYLFGLSIAGTLFPLIALCDDCPPPASSMTSAQLDSLNAKIKAISKGVAPANLEQPEVNSPQRVQLPPPSLADNFCMLNYRTYDAKTDQVSQTSSGEQVVISAYSIWDEICDVPNDYSCPTTDPKPTPDATCQGERYRVKSAPSFMLDPELLSFPWRYYWYIPPKKISKFHDKVNNFIKAEVRGRILLWTQPPSTPTLVVQGQYYAPTPNEPPAPNSLWGKLSLPYLIQHNSYNFSFSFKLP